jgi:hypothetical protein
LRRKKLAPAEALRFETLFAWWVILVVFFPLAVVASIAIWCVQAVRLIRWAMRVARESRMETQDDAPEP